MSLKNNNTGKRGEDIATYYLSTNSYTILNRNYRKRSGEIDIVAFQDNQYIFVEVKSRTSKKFGEPEEAITHTKQKQISIVAQHYITSNNLHDHSVRFDVITIFFKESKSPEINHIQNAFEYTP